MAVTVESFQGSYTEFRETEYDLIQRKISEATRRSSSANLGDLLDDYIMALTAHLLASSPSGEKVRLTKEVDKTIYDMNARRIVKEATIALGRNS
jgi:hypothetical protein